MAFCDEVESIFTRKELEKAPLHDVVQFKAPEAWSLNTLGDQEEMKFECSMNRIAEKVCKLCFKK